MRFQCLSDFTIVWCDESIDILEECETISTVSGTSTSWISWQITSCCRTMGSTLIGKRQRERKKLGLLYSNGWLMTQVQHQRMVRAGSKRQRAILTQTSASETHTATLSKLQSCTEHTLIKPFLLAYKAVFGDRPSNSGSFQILLRT